MVHPVMITVFNYADSINQNRHTFMHKFGLKRIKQHPKLS